MKIVTVGLAGHIRWRINVNDPIKYPIKALPKWYLLNPLRIGSTHPLIPISSSETFLTDNRLLFLVPDSTRFSSVKNKMLIVEMYLKYFRNVSQQVEIPISTALVGLNDLSLINSAPNGFPVQSLSIRKYFYDTAVSKKVIRKVCQMTLKDELPIYHDIILESIAAFSKDDFRKAILYAVIAIETLANVLLDEEYERVLKEKPDFLRVVRIRQSKNKKVTKDPIFEALAERNDFRLSLHERPLYLLKKSLLIDKQAIYTKAVELYKVRNHIVHKGRPLDNISFELNKENAETAINCAFEIFKWFGIKTNYFLPFKYDFIKY